MKMNNHPKIAKELPLLQLAVSSVLQFRDIGNGKFLQNCKDCTLQITFQFAGIKKTEQ